jgi:hypothetical protein
MVHNYAHGPSMFDHLVLPTIIFRKVGPFEHAKSHDLQSHLMWWVLFAASKHNPLARTYEPMINNFLHKSWHTEEYLSIEQLLDSPKP